MSQGSPPRMKIVGLFSAEYPSVMCTTAYLPIKLPSTRAKTRGKNAVRIATDAAGYGTALWLPKMGDREHRPSGSIEVAVSARSMTYVRQYTLPEQTWPQHPFRWCGGKTTGCGKHQLNES